MVLRVCLAVIVLIATSQATPAFDHPYYTNTGTSKQYRSQNDDGSYEFGYDEGHSSGGTFRKETGDAFGNKYGSYGLTDADGRYRVVNYIADEAGFRTDIKTNEPGTVPADPASTTINKAAFLVAPVPVTGIKTAPSIKGIKTASTVKGIKTAPAFTTVQASPAVAVEKDVPVASDFPAFPPFPSSLFYAPDIHHAASPDFPLLYRNSFPTYGNYKGSPFMRRAYNAYYKGSPYVGSPYIGSPYKGIPYISSPYVVSPYPKNGYYIYP